MHEVSEAFSTPIRLLEHRFFRESFRPLYDEVMSLISKTSEYLSGQGRLDSKALSPQASALYDAESIRLATRLMQMASWFLLHRALNEGEMTPACVDSEKKKIQLEVPSSCDLPLFQELPTNFCSFVSRSLFLEARVRCFDKAVSSSYESSDFSFSNPVSNQINLLRTALACG